MNDEFYMKRCIHLATNGLGLTQSNPLVGCVIVYKGHIIGEGYHHQFGGNHAEVNAINTVKDKSLLSESTLYVNLEPCSHTGKTPPCADLLIKYKLKKVVVGMVDPYPLVSGKGIELLKNHHIEVDYLILESSCLKLNKVFIKNIAFLVFFLTKNKYVIFYCQKVFF